MNRHLVTQLTRSHPSINPNPAEARPKPINNCEFSKNVNRRSLFNGAAQPMAKQHPQRPRRLRFSFFKPNCQRTDGNPSPKTADANKADKPLSTSRFSRKPIRPENNRPTSPPYMASPAPNARAKPTFLKNQTSEPPHKRKARQTGQTHMAPTAANRKPGPHPPTENVRTPGQTGRSNNPVKGNQQQGTKPPKPVTAI